MLPFSEATVRLADLSPHVICKMHGEATVRDFALVLKPMRAWQA
jgi:hypothetical protein